MLQLAAHIVKQEVKAVRGVVESCNRYEVLVQLGEIIRTFMLSIKYRSTAIDLLEAVTKRWVAFSHLLFYKTHTHDSNHHVGNISYPLIECTVYFFEPPPLTLSKFQML